MNYSEGINSIIKRYTVEEGVCGEHLRKIRLVGIDFENNKIVGFWENGRMNDVPELSIYLILLGG